MLQNAGKGLVERVEGVMEGVGEYVSRDRRAQRVGAAGEKSSSGARIGVVERSEHQRAAGYKSSSVP